MTEEKNKEKQESMREGFEAQRQAGVNVDWFTWQIAWNDGWIAKELSR